MTDTAMETTKPKRFRTENARQRAFLAAYVQTGTIFGAAKAVGINRASHYRWMDDENYAAAFHVAHQDHCDWLESEATRRGAEGYVVDVWYQGKVVGERREFSDRLLERRLEAELPGKYRKQVLEHSGPHGGPIPIDPMAVLASAQERAKELMPVIEGEVVEDGE